MRCISPTRILNPNRGPGKPMYIFVPCGKCFACQSRKRSEWSMRLTYEAVHSKTSLFVTLTYEDKNLPSTIEGFPTLFKRDLQLFFKRLRKKYPYEHIKYFACGEYGTHTGRPHYHTIIFGLPYHEKRNRFVDYWQDEIALLWANGHVTCSSVNAARIGYLTKYILKSQYDLEQFKILQIQKPFMVCSRRPGIGSDLCTRDKNYINPKTTKLRLYGNSIPLPKYCLDKLDDDLKNEIKLSRRAFCFYNPQKENNSYLADVRDKEKIIRYKRQKDL